MSAPFGVLAATAVEVLLENSPDRAGLLGADGYCDRLDDWSRTAVAQRLSELESALAGLDAVEVDELALPDAIDLELLRDRAGYERWLLAEDRPQHHDPLLYLPVAALRRHPVDRPAELATRLALLPERLAVARRSLRDMSAEHVEAALARCRSLRTWLDRELPRRFDSPDLAEAARSAATALTSFGSWLRARQPSADRDPRVGMRAYHARLWHALDCRVDPDALRTRLQSDLLEVEEELAELATRVSGHGPGPQGPGAQVADLVAELSAAAALPPGNLLADVQQVLTEVTARAREADVVAVPDVDVRLVSRPDRRAAVRWSPCGPPERLPQGDHGVADLPVVTFQRESDRHALRRAVLHAVLPGHLFATTRPARSPGRTAVRTLCQSDVLREGWAGYAEDLFAGAGIGLHQRDDDALRLQVLLARLRATVAGLVDLMAHCDGLSREAAFDLLMTRGHLSEADATATWRQCLLTPAVTLTHYLGRGEVHALVRDLRRQRPRADDRDLHGALLDHGPVPPRLLRPLLGLD